MAPLPVTFQLTWSGMFVTPVREIVNVYEVVPVSPSAFDASAASAATIETLVSSLIIVPF